ncbi:10620_t:CDS:2, partial [Cetraspora pellucida]
MSYNSKNRRLIFIVKKTRILPSVNNDEIQHANISYNILIKQEEDNIETSITKLDQTALPQQQKEQESDDSDKEPLKISVSEGFADLKKFIEFFEQQSDQHFRSEDLNVIRKYLPIMRHKDIESKKQ